jgi:hypothetical protein
MFSITDFKKVYLTFTCDIVVILFITGFNPRFLYPIGYKRFYFDNMRQEDTGADYKIL